jgi:hypothetical protein
MTGKRVFAGIIGIMLMFTAGAANAETIAAYFRCVDDDAAPGDSISLGSDGSCIVVIGTI